MNNVEKYISENYHGLINDFRYSLYHVEYKKNHKEIYLRIFIEPYEHSSAMDIEACEKVSRACSDAFDNDQHFPIKEAYILEVSSPGIERELYIPEHYQRYIGEKVRVRLYKSINNKKEMIAILNAADDQGIQIEVDGEVIDLTYKELSKAQLYCDF